MNTIFKTPESEKQYFELYENLLARWNVKTEALDLKTSFGITHVNTCESSDGPPLILLPGFGANSTMWFPNIASLSSRFHVYAIDTNGQPGKSTPSRKLTALNSVNWLVEVLNILGLKKTHMMGISLGGWLTLNFALHQPERVERIVLLDPAASLEKVSGAFWRHSFIPIMIHPTRLGLIKYFRWTFLLKFLACVFRSL